MGLRTALWTAWIAAAFLAAAAPGRAQEAPPAEARQAAEQLLGSLNRILFEDDDADAEEKRALVERTIRERLDLGAMAAAALGPLAGSFTREQYANLSAEYARYLTHLYVGRLARAEKKFEIVDATYDPEKKVATFRTLGAPRDRLPYSRRRATSDQPSRVDLHFRPRQEMWRMVGLVVEGMSIERNFREQFQSVLGREDPDALIAELHRRNQQLDEENPFAERS